MPNNSTKEAIQPLAPGESKSVLGRVGRVDIRRWFEGEVDFRLFVGTGASQIYFVSDQINLSELSKALVNRKDGETKSFTSGRAKADVTPMGEMLCVRAYDSKMRGSEQTVMLEFDQADEIMIRLGLKTQS